MRVVNCDSEVRLFTARHPVSPTRQHSQNWCLNDVITFTLHQPEDGGNLLFCNDRINTLCIVRTGNTTTVWTIHQHDNMYCKEPSVCLIKYHAVKPNGGGGVRVHTFILALNRLQWLLSCHSHCTPFHSFIHSFIHIP